MPVASAHNAHEDAQRVARCPRNGHRARPARRASRWGRSPMTGPGVPSTDRGQSSSGSWRELGEADEPSTRRVIVPPGQWWLLSRRSSRSRSGRQAVVRAARGKRGEHPRDERDDGAWRRSHHEARHHKPHPCGRQQWDGRHDKGRSQGRRQSRDPGGASKANGTFNYCSQNPVPIHR